MAFCLFIRIDASSLQIFHVLCFMELFVRHNVSVRVITNYFAAIRSVFIMYALCYVPLYQHKIKLLIKAVGINKPLMTIDFLIHLSSLCDHRYIWGRCTGQSC